MTRHRRRRRTPIRQSVQVLIELYAPDYVEPTPKLLHEALDAIAMGEHVPGIRIITLIWQKDKETYDYYDDEAIEALQKAIQVFGGTRKFNIKPYVH